MSNLRIGLVAEGPTDAILIEAALQAFAGRPFVLSLLQPEASLPHLGSGWCGLVKWCRQTASQGYPTLDANPLLSQIDLLIIHLDADVAGKSYADCGLAIGSLSVSTSWPPLPSGLPCPPANAQTRHLEQALTAWMAPALPGPDKTVFCIPAQCTGTWLAAGHLPPGDRLLSSPECQADIEIHLGQLPLNKRIRKSVKEYRAHAHLITRNWTQIKGLCPQAAAFEAHVLAAI